MASTAKWSSYCCNPFGEPHSSKKGSLRPVLEWMIDKMPSLSRDSVICDKCRKKLSLLDHHSSDGHQSNASDSAAGAVGLESLNKSLSVIGESPIKKKRICEKKYTKGKMKKIKSAIKKNILHRSSDSELDSPQNEVIKQLKETFNSTNSKSKKIQILTVLPKSWSIRQITREFSTSNFMARKAKKLVKESGILSSPNPRPGKTLSAETVDNVKEFYNCDEISRIMPGKKDFVSMQEGNQRVHIQKRLILSNIRESYCQFKHTYPNVIIGFSKFAELRPKNCILAGSSGTHSVCVCAIHQNFKLMLSGCKIKDLTKDTENPISDYKQLMTQVMCNSPQPSCYFGDCNECPDIDNFQEKIQNIFDDSGIDYITFKQWISTDRSYLETISKSSTEFTELLIRKLIVLRCHSFIAKQQAKFLSEMKSDIKENQCIAIGDFSENYSFVLQDAVQGFHWNNSQASLHPFVIYYSKDNVTAHLSFVVISDCLIHDTIAVHLFQRRLLVFLTEKFGRKPEKIVYFSDGSAAQYKNKKNFVNLSHHEEDFGVAAEWHFFPTSHGKNACDGIGGTVKRLAARASLQNIYDEQIMTPRQLYDWASSHITGIKFDYVTSQQHIEEERILKARFLSAKTIPGTQRLHCFIPISKNVVCTKRYSSSDTSKNEEICSIVGNLELQEIVGFVTCVYEDKWWLGCVLSSCDETDQVKLTFLHPNGPANSYAYPTKPDILTIHRVDVLTKVDPITCTGRTYTLTYKEAKASNEKLEQYLRK